ncbi:type I DNA topoisomerase [Pectinatus cerevisiiphilus]|uniref:DNA topoisomerase 1 n=1 Tax=Pectinatus cerevisiiphilus TaxID=86956 RepID=A0A4V2USC6_9FIRM|nr:type I DNA topoisomerase [Pectinatus cerevisiiphilus]TCS80932.1 DNA topoisomerase-1 [Pectinatus cerevisiiphilus]
MSKKLEEPKKTTKPRKKKNATKKTLVIVESPAKAKTIEKYLGNRKYEVLASMGHLRDLPKSQFGIDTENNFTPKYINIRGKGDLIKALKKEAKNADKIYLASDPDREGEAIAWHLAYLLGVDETEKCRIVFNEITKPAINEAVKKPRAVNINLVDAQQARRMLDRIVGYKLSPLLWRKVKKGLSAGRVQSVAVKIICDREREIRAFIPEEYWTVGLKFKLDDKKTDLLADLFLIDDKKVSITSDKEAEKIKKDLRKQSFVIADVKKSERRRKAPAPFTTSSLQQDAARKLGFTSRRTMMIAQQLYEGINVGKKGPVGLITYMRTDSTRISELAQNDARVYINDNFGERYLPAKPPIYAAKKDAQDAHEAVRPTDSSLTPASVEDFLSKEQLKLYRLIWQRFLASQMTPAVYDTMTILIKGGSYTAKAVGSVLKFSGFTAVYNDADKKKEKDVILPDVSVSSAVDLQKVLPEQHFTEPPARYNDASIIKTLEEKGIGRPSTYAPIIETILARGYVVRRDKKFEPTELGFIVLDMLEQYFRDIVDAKFTAELEGKLDKVAEGTMDKNKLLQEFYGPFEKTMEKAETEIGHVEIPEEVSDVRCEKCGRFMVVKQGRFSKFLACPGFPECRNTKPILKDTGAKCPKCGGKIVERKTKRGRTFYGCANYPKCDFVSWDMPVADKLCEKCGANMFQHRYKNGRVLFYCGNENCETRKDHPINDELKKMKTKTKDTKKSVKV